MHLDSEIPNDTPVVDNLVFVNLDEVLTIFSFKKELKPETGRASDYINSVNIIYALIRTKLSERAHSGDLSSTQTIFAKKIIHNLNKDSVEAMVSLLGLSAGRMAPDELVKLIKVLFSEIKRLEHFILHQIF